MRRPDIRQFMGVAACCVLAFVPLVLAVVTQWGQRFDERGMRGSLTTWDQRLEIMGGLSRTTLAVAAIVIGCCLAWAWWRDMPGHVVASILAAVGASSTTFVVKHYVIPRPDYGYGAENTLPSGHVTIAMTAALILVFVAPVNGRPLAAVAATIAAAPQAFLTVAVGWHRPSDVLAAVVMALGWITIAVVASVLGGEYQPVPPKRMPLITFAIVLTIVAVTSSMLASLPLDAESTYSSVIRYAVLVLIASVVAWSIAIATWLVDRRDSAARRSVPRAMTTA